MPATRVIGINGLDAGSKQQIMAALQPAISRLPVRPSKGILWGSLMLPVFGICMLLQWNGLNSYYGGGPFYNNPASYIIAAFFLIPVLGFFTYGIIQNGRLKKAPFAGNYLIGGTVVVAGSNSLEVYGPQGIQKVEMRGVSTNLFVQTGGKWFIFPFRDLSHARWGEQQVQMSRQAPTDPFAFLVNAPVGKPNGGNMGWVIGAIAGVALAVPIRYAMGASADSKVYERIYYEDDWSVDGYLGRGGKHEEEVHKKHCDKKIEKANTPKDLDLVTPKCTDRSKEINAKIEKLYADAKADLEKRVPDKARPLLVALLEASKAGSVKTQVIIEGPDPKALEKVDSILDKNKSGIVPVGKTFDKSQLSRREGEVKSKFFSALNALVKDNMLSVVEVDDKSKPALTATIQYDLIPKMRGDNLVVYRWEADPTDILGGGSKNDEVYLGLTISFFIEMKLGDIKYEVAFEAPAASNFSVDTTYGVASTASVYTRMVDTALDNTAENMSKRVFEKDPGPDEGEEVDPDAPKTPAPKKGKTK